MFPSGDMMLVRARTMRELPWVLPAATIIQMTDEDLDRLDAAPDATSYWRDLNRIVCRIQERETQGEAA